MRVRSERTRARSLQLRIPPLTRRATKGRLPIEPSCFLRGLRETHSVLVAIRSDRARARCPQVGNPTLTRRATGVFHGAGCSAKRPNRVALRVSGGIGGRYVLSACERAAHKSESLRLRGGLLMVRPPDPNLRVFFAAFARHVLCSLRFSLSARERAAYMSESLRSRGGLRGRLLAEADGDYVVVDDARGAELDSAAFHRATQRKRGDFTSDIRSSGEHERLQGIREAHASCGDRHRRTPKQAGFIAREVFQRVR